MPLIEVRNNYTKDLNLVSEEWLTRWPDDYTRVGPTDSPKETPTPVTGTNKKEKA